MKKIIVQEYYDSWTLQNDICILILEKPADTSSQFVSTIALPSDESDYISGTSCQETALSSLGGIIAKILFGLPAGTLVIITW